MIVRETTEPVRAKALVRIGSDLHLKICAIAEKRRVQKTLILEEAVLNGLIVIDLSCRYPIFRRIFSEYMIQSMQEEEG